MYSSVVFPLLVIFLNEATSQPPLPPQHRHSGDKVVIVVQNENGQPPLPPSSMLMSESKMSERKSILGPSPSSNLKRRGQPQQKHNIEDSPALGGGKKEKSLLTKLIPTSGRHISGPSDMFRKKFHHTQKSPHGLDEKPPRQPPPQYGSGPPFGDFRPHQPDITQEMQGGKLSLPVGFNENQLQSLKPRPTPMANKINPYTNGVAASFPPGIDPYDGFMRYAAENLETPMGNFIDYHSLEHYYGPQHPLSPYYNPNNKNVNLNNPYADNYSYNQIDMGNAPPSLPPPQQDGFRNHGHNSQGQDNPSPRYNHPNSLSQYEHGIDHFNAPSPGLSSTPPRSRPPTESLSYEEGVGHRTPPFESPPPDHPSFTQNHHAPPFKHSSGATGLELNQQFHGGHENSPHTPHPPDLDVFDEGPPQIPHLPVPLPPDAPPHAQSHGHAPPPPHHHQDAGGQHPEHGNAPSGDGGEDGIWGILDLAEMLEKGQLPGQPSTVGSSSPGKGKPFHGPPQPNSPPIHGKGRIVIPIFTRPPPPRSSSNPGIPSDHHHGRNVPPPPPELISHSHEGHQSGPPPPVPIPHPEIDNQDGPPRPLSNAPKYPYSGDGFDYDDNSSAGLGGNLPGPNGRPSPQYSSLDSQEHDAANDYNDDYKR